MMEQRSGRTHIRVPRKDSDDDLYQTHITHASQGALRSRPKDSMRTSYPQPPLTPNAGALPSTLPPSISNPLLPSAPASPPTPAPSPTPHQRPTMWAQQAQVQNVEDYNEPMLREFCALFGTLSVHGKEQWMSAIVDVLDNHMLNHVKHLVSPRLKKDPFAVLPNELCFKILEHVDNPQTLVRASQVSHRWREILNDDAAWKAMCDKHAYRRTSSASLSSLTNSPLATAANHFYLDQLPHAHDSSSSSSSSQAPQSTTAQSSAVQQLRAGSPSSPGMAPQRGKSLLETLSLNAAGNLQPHQQRLTPTQANDLVRVEKGKPGRPRLTHRSHFKHRFMVESAWRKGGKVTARHITPDQGVVTSLHLTPKFIVLSMDTARIHVFDVKGNHLRMLLGHLMGVWAMVPWGDTLVSGGCDRDVRVWNMETGDALHCLRGHTSTVRCLKMASEHIAISGSRDATLRVWDLTSGTCKFVLAGHQASVRCVEIHGDLIVSGSYDTTAKIWSVSTGQCLRTLSGHFSQIYAVAFDGRRIATGSLDTSVRVWRVEDGQCLSILQGHTSLVGQLQLRGSLLVSGGSDGSVRVWSLRTAAAVHRLAAHDNSVTSLQFDDARIVSGGSDGRVKIWDLKTGALIRELSQPADAVWRVAFEEETAVVLCSRFGRTVMEVWDFAPEGEEEEGRDGGGFVGGGGSGRRRRRRRSGGEGEGMMMEDEIVDHGEGSMEGVEMGGGGVRLGKRSEGA